MAACASKPKVVYVEKPYALPPPDFRKVRVPDVVHAYAIGRLPTKDGKGMDEAHTYYRIEESAHWDERLPSRPLATTGPVDHLESPTARHLPASKELAAAEDQARSVAADLQKARQAYLQAAQGMQRTALDINKTRATVDALQAMLNTANGEVQRLRAENARLRLVTPEEPKGRPEVDGFKNLEDWEKTHGNQ